MTFKTVLQLIQQFRGAVNIFTKIKAFLRNTFGSSEANEEILDKPFPSNMRSPPPVQSYSTIPYLTQVITGGQRTQQQQMSLTRWINTNKGRETTASDLHQHQQWRPQKWPKDLLLCFPFPDILFLRYLHFPTNGHYDNPYSLPIIMSSN